MRIQRLSETSSIQSLTTVMYRSRGEGRDHLHIIRRSQVCSRRALPLLLRIRPMQNLSMEPGSFALRALRRAFSLWKSTPTAPDASHSPQKPSEAAGNVR
jgi:hypothetical protein